MRNRHTYFGEKIEKILWTLLRAALGDTECSLIGYEGVTPKDWNAVYDLAMTQGLTGIVFSAIERLPKMQMPPMDVLMDWLGQVEYMRTNYAKYAKIVCSFCDKMREAGIKAMVMKGYGCSLNYPIPSVRPCGDIDIFLMECGKKCDFHKGNKLIQDLLGLRLFSHGNHHSIFKYNGFIVENHQTVLDINSHKSNLYLNTLLEEAAKECREVEIDGKKIYLPSMRFNTIHLLRHMASDFATFTTSLRHVIDWATFIKQNDVDWQYVQEVAKEANMINFLDVINSICAYYLGYPSDMFPTIKADLNLQRRVLDDILYNTDRPDIPANDITLIDKICYGMDKTIRMYHNRWKYNIVYDESLWDTFVSHATYCLKN